jgi:flavin-dependent dehydrogenase
MTAAINLAKQGYEVTILEKEKKIGGSPVFHPSLHVTPVDLRLTSEFTGIDLYNHFPLLTDFQTWAKDKRIPARLNNYGAERGGRATSLDTHLFKLCKSLGVKFQFGQSVKKLSDVPPGSIIATGLTCAVDDFKNIDIVDGHGFSFVMESKIGPSSWQFKDVYSPDYFYAGAMNGIIYGLVFGRRAKIDKEAIKIISDQFQERTGIEIKAEWRSFSAVMMLGTRLYFGPGNKYIMTGSASGSQDPYFGFGIVGALTSGKIASLAVCDPEGAQVLFSRINRNYKYLYNLFEIHDKMPDFIKLQMYKALPKYYKFLKPVFGRVGFGIPGYPRNWIEELTGNTDNCI